MSEFINTDRPEQTPITQSEWYLEALLDEGVDGIPED